MMEARKRSLQAAIVFNKNVVVDFLPDKCTTVVAHCEEYSCLAFLDPKGIWRGRYKESPLESRVVAWEPI